MCIKLSHDMSSGCWSIIFCDTDDCQGAGNDRHQLKTCKTILNTDGPERKASGWTRSKWKTSYMVSITLFAYHSGLLSNMPLLVILSSISLSQSSFALGSSEMPPSPESSWPSQIEWTRPDRSWGPYHCGAFRHHLLTWWDCKMLCILFV